ncbi:Hint domain-containing protein [Mangrovicoccus algicola]|uniref:Hint domain-containing protein n=1 Tax=Mangrovicoccus algicola TaxID=2771008 RepID=A0A8J6YSL0_9RHOB|nr:Hint domain-containing protein [Mangrovicoccus algicola]MBE3636592.1 Hint domain-containing protein [Mangrovicoccus algicola]
MASHGAGTARQDPADAPQQGPGGSLSRDTRLQTPGGMRRISDLKVGDLVGTQDRGPQEILWIGRTRLSRAALAAAPWLCPVRIRRGALAPGLPRRDLIVAPLQRIALRDPAFLRRYRSATVMLPALALVDGGAISTLPPNRGWTLYQLLLPHHALLLTEGCASESLAGEAALRIGAELAIRIDGLPVVRNGLPRPAPSLGEARGLWRGRGRPDPEPG